MRLAGIRCKRNKCADRRNTQSNMWEDLVLWLNIVYQTKQPGTLMPLIRCPLGKGDHFQRSKQGSTLPKFYIDPKTRITAFFLLLSSFPSFTCTRTLTHTSKELEKFTTFQTFKLIKGEIGGEGAGGRRGTGEICPVPMEGCRGWGRR